MGFRLMTGCCLCLLLAAPAGATDPAALPRNPVLKRLIDVGVALGGDRTESLTSPTLADGLDRAAQRSVVTGVAGRHGWSRFVRDSVVAPIALQLRSLKDADGNRVGHSVDLWFVAYGSLETLSDEELLKDIVRGESGKDAHEGKAEELDEAQLTRNGIDRQESRDNQEKFIYGEFPLLGRVHVAGVGHTIYCRRAQSILVAWELDERFAADAELRGRWRPIRADQLGRKQLGPAQAFRGYGGYGKITPLAGPAGALFVECHFVFHEPEQWFTGSNLIRAKMPLLMQESVRKFRRRLKKAEEGRGGME